MSDQGKLLVRREIPDLHLVMIIVVFCITISSIIFYFFAPAEKSGLYEKIILGCCVFLSGKLSNGFGKPLYSKRTTDRKPDDGA